MEIIKYDNCLYMLDGDDVKGIITRSSLTEHKFEWVEYVTGNENSGTLNTEALAAYEIMHHYKKQAET